MHPSKRQKLLLNPLPKPKVPFLDKGKSIYLDLLPKEVCARIAMHVSHGQQTHSALSLALATPVQRLAVLESLKHNLHIQTGPLSLHYRYIGINNRPELCTALCRDHCSVRWIFVYANRICVLTQSGFSVQSSVSRIIEAVILRPRILMATIVDHPNQVSAVAHSQSISRLSVVFSHSMPAVKVFEAISCSKVTKLSIVCLLKSQPVYPCPFEDFRIAEAGLETYLHQVRSLMVSCSCCLRGQLGREATQEMHVKLWRRLSNLKRMKILRLSQPGSRYSISKEALECLASMDGVQLIDWQEPVTLASMTGIPLIEIQKTNSHVPVCADDLLQLKEFPRLLSLEIHIQMGAEVIVLDAMPHLPHLKQLLLTWSNQGLRGDLPWAEPGLLRSIVEAGPRLSELNFMNVHVYLSELLDILEIMGPRLQGFGTCITSWEEPAYERLSALLICAMKNNRSIRRFSVHRTHMPFFLRDEESVSDWRKVTCLVNIFSSRRPAVNIQILREFVRVNMLNVQT